MIFREKVAKKVSTPDDMDILAKITTPVGWMTLLTAFVLFSSLLIWSFLGEIPTTLTGNGLLMYSGGIVQLPAPISGTVQSVNIKEGKEITEGDTIAEIYYADAELQISKLQNDIKRTAQNTSEFLRLQSELENVLNKVTTSVKIKAPNNGNVISIYKNNNEFVREGEPFVLIATGSSNDNLQAIVYVAGANAKRLKSGMTVRMELGDVKADKYGYLLGKIDKVSEYPVNAQSINKNTGNDTLANWLVGGSNMGGAVGGSAQPIFAVQVSLFPDAVSKSGYVWTTVAGGPAKLTPGTPLTAFCVVSKKRPIELVFEWIRVFLGGE